MPLGNFTRRAKFLEKVSFQDLKGVSSTDKQLVDMAQDIWDAEINSGDDASVINLPQTTMEGVEIDWDQNKDRFVLNKGTIYLRDNLKDNNIPESFDAAATPPLTFHDDGFVVLEGGAYDDELVILEGNAGAGGEGLEFG